MRAPGIVQTTCGMKQDGVAAAIHILVLIVFMMLQKPMVFMDGKQHAKNVHPLLVTQVMVNEPQKKTLFKVHGGKYAAPEAPGDRTIGHVIKRINLTVTQKTRGMAFPKSEGSKPTMKTRT